MRLHIEMNIWVALVRDCWNFGWICTVVVMLLISTIANCSVPVSVSANNAMLPSMFGVVDDVYAAVDWDISRSVDVNDGCFDGNVSGWSWSDSRSRFTNNGMAGSQKRAIHPTRRDSISPPLMSIY